MKDSPEALLEVELAAADSRGGPDTLDRVVESNLVVTQDALGVIRSEVIKESGVEMLCLPGKKSKHQEEVPLAVEESMNGHHLGHEVGSNFKGSVNDEVVGIL